MEDNEGGEVTPQTGNEWEVVQLTSSAYNAAPGPKQVDSTQDKFVEKNEFESPASLFTSGHFVFPPSQHENLPVEPEYSEIHDQGGGEEYVSKLIDEKGEKMDVKNDENSNIDQEQSAYSTTGYSSFDSEVNVTKSDTVEDRETIDDSTEPLDHDMDSSLPNDADLPCEAWWKRRVISLMSTQKRPIRFGLLSLLQLLWGLWSLVTGGRISK